MKSTTIDRAIEKMKTLNNLIVFLFVVDLKKNAENNRENCIWIRSLMKQIGII